MTYGVSLDKFPPGHFMQLVFGLYPDKVFGHMHLHLKSNASPVRLKSGGGMNYLNLLLQPCAPSVIILLILKTQKVTWCKDKHFLRRLVHGTVHRWEQVTKLQVTSLGTHGLSRVSSSDS